MSGSERYDFLIVGGGIVGLASALNLSERFPGRRIVVIEKEGTIGAHQTGHNSGVLHSGIYYKPGSLKATNCRRGKARMERFCAENDIPFEICGKVIVAVDESELGRLDDLYQRGLANGVICERIGTQRLHELEPHCSGIAAIHVRETGIVNFRRAAERLAELLERRGHCVTTGSTVTAIEERSDLVRVVTTTGEHVAEVVINCAGLESDRVARSAGAAIEARIVPFRGEYFALRPERRVLCRNLIYPVPDPRFPFLGVHFTRMISGEVECGPNAVLAFAREGYTKSTISPGDLLETLSYSGFRRMAARYWRMGASEIWRSFSKRAFVAALKRLIPEIEAGDLLTAPAGVRAQAVAPDGTMLDDFAISESTRVVNIVNAPSPAATASLSIGELIADRVAERLDTAI